MSMRGWSRAAVDGRKLAVGRVSRGDLPASNGRGHLGDVPTGSGSLIAGAITFAAGILYIAVAVGASFTFPWARNAGIVTAILGLAAGVFTLATTGALAHAIATFVFPIFLLWYLNRDKVTVAFNRD